MPSQKLPQIGPATAFFIVEKVQQQHFLGKKCRRKIFLIHRAAYALLQITEMIKESIDNHKYGCGIFIDLRKAFDTVNKF